MDTNVEDIDGKLVKLFDPGLTCTEDEFKKYLSKFNRFFSLAIIADLATKLFYKQIEIYYRVPVLNFVLEFLAKNVVEYSSDLTKRDITDTELAEALRMSYYLLWKDFHANPKDKILMDIGFNQFSYQEIKKQALSRHFYFFHALWYNYELTKDLDVLQIIEDITGIPYELIVYFTYAFLGQCKDKGYFYPYSLEKLEGLCSLNKHRAIDLDCQKKYFNWISGDYEQIRKTRLFENPFKLYPIIETKTKPLPDKEEIYLIISPPLLIDRVTKGIYFLLADYFNKGGPKNKFKERFGFIFQEYVGKLLENHFTKWAIHPEIKYKKGKKQDQDSIDWIAYKDNKAILFEVKHSPLRLDIKESQDLIMMQDELKEKIFIGYNQLNVTKNDILSGTFPELQEFINVSQFELVIVLYEALNNENSVVKSWIEELEAIDHLTIINIGDLVQSFLMKHKE